MKTVLILCPSYNHEKKMVTSGVDYHRLFAPHFRLMEDKKINLKLARSIIDLTNRELQDIDIAVFSKFCEVMVTEGSDHYKKGTYFSTLDTINKLKDNGCNVVLDLDDTWNLDKGHPLYSYYQRKWGNKSLSSQVVDAILNVDVVTVTNAVLKNDVKRVYGGADVEIIPNGIDPENPQFSTEKQPSDRVRFGFSKAVSHKDDLEWLGPVLDELYKNPKFKLVYMGYNPENPMTVKTHRLLSRNENVSREQYSVLPMTTPDKYGYYYKGVDVLLTPLGDNFFNKRKSHLKMIECGFTGTVFLGSEVTPYKEYISRNNSFSFSNNKGLFTRASYIIDNLEEAKDKTKRLTMDMQEFDLSKVNEKRIGVYESFE